MRGLKKVDEAELKRRIDRTSPKIARDFGISERSARLLIYAFLVGKKARLKNNETPQTREGEEMIFRKTFSDDEIATCSIGALYERCRRLCLPRPEDHRLPVVYRDGSGNAVMVIEAYSQQGRHLRPKGTGLRPGLIGRQN